MNKIIKWAAGIVVAIALVVTLGMQFFEHAPTKEVKTSDEVEVLETEK
ncbi:hypothetical protein ACIQWI_08180 [Peribacillus frigoritolerans]